MLYDPNWKPTEVEVPTKVKKKKARKTWRSLVLKAAEILEKDGWVQGALYEEGSFCTLGALQRADGLSIKAISNETIAAKESKTLQIAVSKLEDFIVKQTDGAYFEILDWNDDSDTTKEEVIKTLRKAAG